MTGLLEIRLPDEIMENLPSDKSSMVTYLSKHLDKVLEAYDAGFQRRVHGVLGGPLSRYEKSILKDFLLDAVLGKKLREALEAAPTSPFEKIADTASIHK
jgi:hypothetical protein